MSYLEMARKVSRKQSAEIAESESQPERVVRPESTEPIVPSRADCGCAGPVCRRCWLCAEVHCRCLSKTACWHCGGVGRCGCSACWQRFAGEVAECVVCHGSGKIVEWVE
jgi:hypothetical protein